MVEMKLLRWKNIKLEKEAVTKMKMREKRRKFEEII